MLAMDGDNLSDEAKSAILSRKWMIAGLILHCFNLKNGCKCTGFDEDDPAIEGELKETGILNLPSNFNEISSEIMTFRYTHERCKEGEDLMVKIIFDDSTKSIDVNAMSSLS